MAPALVLTGRVDRSATLSLAPIRANLVRRFVVSISVPPMTRETRETRASPGRFARQSDPEVGAPPGVLDGNRARGVQRGDDSASRDLDPDDPLALHQSAVRIVQEPGVHRLADPGLAVVPD